MKINRIQIMFSLSISSFIKSAIFLLIWVGIILALVGIGFYYNEKEWEYIEKGLAERTNKYFPIVDEYHEKCQKMFDMAELCIYLSPLPIVLGYFRIKIDRRDGR